MPEKTQIAAKDIIFETEKNMLAIPAKLVKAYSIDINGDAVYESPLNVISNGKVIPVKTTLLYDAKTQDSTIYVDNSEGINKGDLLIINKSEYVVISEISDLKITLSHKLDNDHQAGNTVEKVITFELFEGKNLQEHILYLGHEEILNLKEKAYILIGIKPFIKDSLESASVLWEYWGEDDNKKLGWHNLNIKQPLKAIIDFIEGIFNIDVIVLEKDKIGEIKKHKVNEKESLWIRCRVKDRLVKEDLLSQIKIDYLLITSLPWFDLNMGIAGLTGIQADRAFHNDIPLELTLEDTSENFTNSVYPFGNIPRLFDTFYIASKEAFSKKGANIILKFNITPPSTGSTDLRLSWEYWNGKGWQVLTIIKDETNRFLQPGDKKVEFNCPEDIEETEVSGQKNYWIRTRIISGDYGKEKFVKGVNDTWIINTGDIKPPKFNNLTIIYIPKPQSARYCFAYNNLMFRDVTEEGKDIDSKSFNPFMVIDDAHQSMYLGFDKKLEKGPICIFFSIEEQLWDEKLPAIE
ncbi:MAG: hypothetical protein AB1610_04865 [Nitrospirota bacterium]